MSNRNQTRKTQNETAATLQSSEKATEQEATEKTEDFLPTSLRYLRFFLLKGPCRVIPVERSCLPGRESPQSPQNDRTFRQFLSGFHSYNFSWPFLLLILCSVHTGSAVAGEGRNADSPPVIPVGLDAFSQWDRWAYLRIGQRTYMTSTYDRRGGNEAADASHFLYQLADDRNVSLDVMGPGVLAFKRTNHWHGSPWHYIVDGNDYLVQESSTADPEHPKENSVFIPERQFPNPLTWTWSITKGADLMWVPIMFEKSFTLAYGRTHYGTGYYIYHKFLPGIDYLSRPIRSWSIDEIPPEHVLDLIRRSGGGDIVPAHAGLITESGRLDLAARDSSTFVRLVEGPRMIRSLSFRVAEPQAAAFGECRLRIWWDGREFPSIDAPVKLLYGTGSLFNRDSREYLVKAFPVSIRFHEGQVYFSMYFPMPFFRMARMELAEVHGQAVHGVEWSIRHEAFSDPANHVGHFHATYFDHPSPTRGRDIVMLDTTRVEGGGDWCGHFVGTSFIFSHKGVLTTLEGDPRFYFDDSQSPQAQGTGTEEWGGGGDYWGGRTMTLPFAGHPVGCPKSEAAKNEQDLIQSEYRFLLSDLFPFGKNAKITFEHGGENNSGEHYASVVFWYGLNRPFLKLTDSFNVGDEQDEKRHAYESPQASPVQTLSSRYEWGVDHLDGKEIFPETSDTGRFTEGSSTFVMNIDPANIGVMLRRKMDYSFPNQCARVFVSDADESSGQPGEHEVGRWYTAGSNTVVYSNPKGELGKTEHHVQTSNRRWREDEFLLPPALTRGKSKIRVRVQFVPRDIPLFPGYPLPRQAWSEYHYWAYSFVMPRG